MNFLSRRKKKWVFFSDFKQHCKGNSNEETARFSSLDSKWGKWEKPWKAKKKEEAV